MKDAETPVFTRVFGVFYIRTAENPYAVKHTRV